MSFVVKTDLRQEIIMVFTMWKSAVSFCLLSVLASSNIKVVADPLESTVAILQNQKAKCLGMIVDNKYIATSAHCVFGSEGSSLSIKILVTNNNTEAAYETGRNTAPEVLRVIIHPYYTPPSPDYDIALLKVTSLSTTAVPIGKTEPSSQDSVQAIYWNPQNSKNSLTLENVKIEDRKSCKDKVGKFVTGRMVCAYNNNTSLTSDGPLIFDNKLIGVFSKRFGSNQKALPDIYTNIANSEIYFFIENYV